MITRVVWAAAWVDGQGVTYDKDSPSRGAAMSETYLGDGLYVSFDGWQIMLRAPRENGDHWIALEPEVYEALLKFVRALKPAAPSPSDDSA
jgi:hypothetical protein